MVLIFRSNFICSKFWSKKPSFRRAGRWRFFISLSFLGLFSGFFGLFLRSFVFTWRLLNWFQHLVHLFIDLCRSHTVETHAETMVTNQFLLIIIRIDRLTDIHGAIPWFLGPPKTTLPWEAEFYALDKSQGRVERPWDYTSQPQLFFCLDWKIASVAYRLILFWFPWPFLR